ncbi:MAG: Uroporphyrinogen decarboxylase (URO-D) [Lentisphaerae bacterium ADurb.BinA184]|nr:MAG: Uroporphyrinogen decarboxylase (URO-D) [Lentisphaerae bacterium ADurb.BinA184]
MNTGGTSGMTPRHNEITASLWVQYAWGAHEGPNPAAWRSAAAWDAARQAAASAGEARLAEVRRAAPALEETVRALHERFGAKRRVSEQREKRGAVPPSTWPGWYEPRDVIAIALGASEPVWMNNMWWHDRHRYPLAAVASAAELARLKIPDWPRTDVVRRMLDSCERWRKERPDDPPARFAQIWENLPVPGRGEVPAICYPSCVDLGIYLMGATRFLTILGGEPALADAFLELCFDLSVSYTEYLLSLRPEPFAGLCGFGGDATFFLSPPLYERYSAAWDARLFEHVRPRHALPADAPCNLHSCGASAHLYGSWARHPCRANITAVQTRLIPGTVGRLRDALPNTELELTLHPPEFDLTTAEPDAVRAVLRQSAAEAGCRDVHFAFIATVQRPEGLARLARNAETVLEEIAGLRLPPRRRRARAGRV